MTETGASGLVAALEREPLARGRPDVADSIQPDRRPTVEDPRAPRSAAAMSAQTICYENGCGPPARICRECVRALAFQWWGAIARHDLGASLCELCEHTGGACYCAEHALDTIVEHRALMRSLGHRIGEPPPVDITDLVSRGQG
jgi:hypothetical protein